MRTLRSDPVRRDRLIIAVAYTLAWGSLLLNRGFYWDDWTIVGLSPADLLRQFGELGLPLGGYFYAALFALPLPGLVGHAVVFVAYLLSTLILHAILGRISALTRMDSLIATLTVALLPVNFARIAVIDLMYGLSLLAFLAATWLLIRYLAVGGLGRRTASLILFLLSFYTASLLVLYIVPLAVGAVIVRRSGDAPLRVQIMRHLDFLLLPIGYWLFKTAFLTPSGAYAGYNALTGRGLSQVPKAMLAIPGEVLVEPLWRAISVAGLVGIVIGAIAAVLLVRWSRNTEREPDSAAVVPAPALALIGVIVLALGVFAYVAVGRIPEIWDWSSRHQLLVPLGVGLLAAAVARGVRVPGPAGRWAGIAVIGLLLGVSAVADARTLFAYQVDWFKQQAIIEVARATPAMATARHIRVVDTAAGLNALRRTYRFYEFNALFSQALGGANRLASLGRNEPSADDLALYLSRPAYHMGQYVAAPVNLELRIAPGTRPGVIDTLRLLVLEATGSAAFGPEVSRLVNIQATPVAAAGAAP